MTSRTAFIVVMAASVATRVVTADAEELACKGFRAPTCEYWQTASHDQVKACLQRETSLDARNAKGETPLHLAVSCSTDERVSALLLDAGADPRARTKGDLTPLHMLAERVVNPAVVAKLALKGADPNALKDPEEGWLGSDRGTTALHLAAKHDDTGAVLRALLAAGAATDPSDSLGRSALHWASRFAPDPVAVESLLVNGADPNAADDESWMPLHLAAAHSCSPELVSALIGAGAEPDAEGGPDPEQTPLRIAAAHSRCPAVFGLLIKETSEPCAEDDEGRTALRLAEENDALRDSEPYYWELFKICRE